MMIFTHVLMGLLLGTGVAFFYPDFLTVAVAAGLAGGVFPDLDMVFVHRRTLHFPVLFSLATGIAGTAVVIRPSLVTVAVFAFVIAAAVHSLTDVLGGGKEMRPWKKTDDRAVYNHVSQRWLSPWRVFYDGSVPDLVLSVAMAVVLFFTLPPEFHVLIGGLLVLATAYTLLRRWITRKISEDYQTFSAYIQHKLGFIFGR